MTIDKGLGYLIIIICVCWAYTKEVSSEVWVLVLSDLLYMTLLPKKKFGCP